ncbi:MAG TPA: helix-turn-helix transcriptional regulator [Prolixibacteraceae bacterium]|nr:helix-turn-helix transcriptional regulator [Prolixibacteraceae bacterium]
MELSNMVQVTLGTTGIINGLVIAMVLFLLNRGNRKANHLLGLLLVAVCLKLGYALLINIQHEWQAPSLWLYYDSESAYFSFGPLLLLYFHALLSRRVSPLFRVAMFIPALSPFVGHFIPFDVPLWPMQLWFLIFLLIISIQFKSVIFSGEKSSSTHPDQTWLQVLFVSFSMIWLTANLLFIDFKFYFLELLAVVIAAIYVALYSAIRFYWFREGDKLKVPKYVNSTLTEDEANTIMLKLKRVMEVERLYIDPEITLPKVAERLQIRPHKLSQVINQQLNMTFNEYINSCRIREIKGIMKLPEYQNLKIASIAYDYGFNTISSFNTAFKKFTHYTPSQYRNEQLVDNRN